MSPRREALILLQALLLRKTLLKTKNRMLNSLRKHPFLLALRRWGRFATPAAKSEEKRMFSQATC